MRKLKICIIVVLILLSFPLMAFSQIYEVGPGKPYENIGNVPWENLNAGDQVLIYWRAQPYKEKWVVVVQGTEEQPFLILGVPNQDGEFPVIDGRDATTRSQLNFWNENRGVLKLGGSNNPPDITPTWIVIENLDIRSGRPPYQFTGRQGLTDYAGNCAAIFIEKGEHIIIRNCLLRDSGNGLFASHASKNVLVDGCWIYDNGIEGSIYMHNNYTETFGITFQYNYFGPLRAGCLGNNLKDRSAGTIIRYNWLESGNRQLDLVDSDYPEFYNSALYRQTFVYGNILIEPDDAGNSQIVHYGGDSGDTQRYRKGTMYFYNNTVVSTRTGNTTLFRLSTNDEHCDCRNNIVYVTAPGNRLAMLNSEGILDIRNSWFKSGWRDSHGSLTGEIHDNGGIINGDTPAFLDEASQDYRLATGSVCINSGCSLDPAALPDNDVIRQYVKHQKSEARPRNGIIDIGAYDTPPAPRNLRVTP